MRRSLAAVAFALVAPPAWAQLAVEAQPDNPQVAAAWQALADADLTFLAGVIQRDYIYANYPGGPAWDRLAGDNLARARREVRLVKDYGGYRAVIQHYVVSFQDAHLSAYFQVTSHAGRWPGFTLKYSGGRYVVAKSMRKDVAAGVVVEGCDGRSLDAWTDELSQYLGGPRGRETTRATIAEELMIDTGNPLYAPPKACRIAGRDVALTWDPLPEGLADDGPARSGESPSTMRDAALSLSDFGHNGAWVRIGTMMAETRDQADAFQRLIDAAPGLRTKDVIVLDVRGNRGGVYNWFMAFLRGLYGQPYADYFARARLEITNVVMNPPGEPMNASAGFVGEAATIKQPADPPMTFAPPEVTKLPNGGELIHMVAPAKTISYPAAPPPSPVNARVYVLTDFGCASACLSFLDEIMRFPGVTLVGAETHIDRRAGGFPTGYTTPSGLVVARMGRMVRDDRARGENEAWAPAAQYRYPGDIADTYGVRQWLLSTVLPMDRAAGAKWTQTARLKGPE